MTASQKLRDLPAVHEVLERLSPALARFPRALVVAEIRRALHAMRVEITGGHTNVNDTPIATRVEQALLSLETPSVALRCSTRPSWTR